MLKRTQNSLGFQYQQTQLVISQTHTAQEISPWDIPPPVDTRAWEHK